MDECKPLTTTSGTSGALGVGAALGTATLDCINPRGPLAGGRCRLTL